MRSPDALARARRWGERWMQSGLARDTLALMAFMVAALLAATLIFDRMWLGPRVEAISWSMVGHMSSLSATVRRLPESERDDFLKAVENRSGGYLFVDDPARWGFRLPEGNVRARSLRRMSELMPQENLSYTEGNPSMLWLPMDDEQGRTRWVRMVMPGSAQAEFNFALAVAGLFACFGFAGALFLLLRVRRSLSGVDDVVAQLEGHPSRPGLARRMADVAARLARAQASRHADLVLAAQELRRLHGHLGEVAVASVSPARELMAQLDEPLGQFERHVRGQAGDAPDPLAAPSTAPAEGIRDWLRPVADFVLVLALAGAAIVATGWAAERFIVNPRSDDGIQVLAMQISSMRAIAATLPRDRLQPWLQDVERYSQGVLRADDPARHVTGEATSRPHRAGLRRMRALVPDVSFMVSPSPQRALWFALPSAAGDQWVRLNADGLAPPAYPFLLAAGGLMVSGAAWIVLRAQQRVRRVAGRVEQIESGNRREPPDRQADVDDATSMDPRLRDTLHRLVRAKEEQALLLADLSLDMRSLLQQLRETQPPRDAGLQARACIDQMVQLLERLNRFAPAQDDPTLEPVDLNLLLSEAATAGGGSVRLRLEGLPFVRIRPADVARLVDSLVDNAMRHGAPPVTLTSSLESGWVVLRVLDRGPGLPADVLLQFEKSHARVHDAAAGGNGIGLAVVRHIAEAHGGLLRLLRREGGGLQVEVWLPPARLPRQATALEERVP